MSIEPTQDELEGISEYVDLENMDYCRGHGPNLRWQLATKRFPSLNPEGQAELSYDELIRLMTASFIVQEKLLGTTRSVRWKEGTEYVLHFCDMMFQRFVGYNWGIPARYILFNITKYGTQERIPFIQVQNVAAAIGFPTVGYGNLGVYPNGIQESEIGRFLDDQVLDQRSAYGDQGNGGFVILSEADLTLSGKYARYNGTSGDVWAANLVLNTING